MFFYLEKLKLPLCIALLASSFACQVVKENDGAKLAADASASAEIKRIGNNVAAGRPVTPADLEALNKLYEKYPGAIELRATMSAAFIRRQDWDALDAFLSRIPDADKSDQERVAQANTRIKQGKFAEAVEMLRPVMAKGPANLDVASSLSQAQFHLGQLDDAAATLDGVKDKLIAGKKADDLALRGMIFFRKGESDKAVEALKQVLGLAPESLTALNTLAQIYAAKGDAAASDSYRTKAESVYAAKAENEKRKSRLVPMLYQLEDAFKAKNYDEVISTAQRILPEADDRNKAAVYQYMAQAYQAQGKPAEAQKAQAEAAKLTK